MRRGLPDLYFTYENNYGDYERIYKLTGTVAFFV
jgi:hypothetical protein